MKKLILLFSVLLVFFVACNSKKKTEENQTDTTTSEVIDGHNAQNSLNYYGTYEGVTPCADCEGIKVIVSLNQDDTYTLKNIYLKNGEEANPSEFTGKFTWDETGSIITLDGATDVPSRFFVGEGSLTILDEKGERISGELAEHYVLEQIEAL